MRINKLIIVHCEYYHYFKYCTSLGQINKSVCLSVVGTKTLYTFKSPKKV